MKLDAYQHVFAVVGGQRTDGRPTMDPSEVCGTAFPIGGNFWLTAAHVLRGAGGHPMAGLLWWENRSGGRRRSRGCVLGRAEIHAGHDVGVFEASISDATLLPWSTRELPMAEDVMSIGFPYALEKELGQIGVRTFKGHVVAAGPTRSLPARPDAYELNFQCPRGLSGAPLLAGSGSPVIAGVVVGNESSKMLVFSESEVVKESGTTTIVERYESLHLGLAVQSAAILRLEFKNLGRGLGDHLAAHGLLAAGT